MERLTKYSNETTHENDICCTHFGSSECCEVGGNCALDCKWAETAWERLARYEDTGLTPAEVLSMSGEWCAMMSVLNSIGSYDHLMELAKADKEGRVAVLPCKVGDTLYQLSSAYTECTVYRVRKDNYCCEGCEVPCDSRKVMFIKEIRLSSLAATIRCCEELGKTMFLTREEAAKALEEEKRCLEQEG